MLAVCGRKFKSGQSISFLDWFLTQYQTVQVTQSESGTTYDPAKVAIQGFTNEAEAFFNAGGLGKNNKLS